MKMPGQNRTKNVVNYRQKKMTCWFGHVQHMADSKRAKQGLQSSEFPEKRKPRSTTTQRDIEPMRNFDRITADLRSQLHWLSVQQRIEYKAGVQVST